MFLALETSLGGPMIRKRGTVGDMAAFGHQGCSEPTAMCEHPTPERITGQEGWWGSAWSSPQGLPDRGGTGPGLPENLSSSTMGRDKRRVWKVTENLFACCLWWPGVSHLTEREESK